MDPKRTETKVCKARGYSISAPIAGVFLIGMALLLGSVSGGGLSAAAVLVALPLFTWVACPAFSDPDDDGGDSSKTLFFVPARPPQPKVEESGDNTPVDTKKMDGEAVATPKAEPAASQKMSRSGYVEVPEPMSRTVVFDPQQVEAMREQVAKGNVNAASIPSIPATGPETNMFGKSQVDQVKSAAAADVRPFPAEPLNSKTFAYIPAYKEKQDKEPPMVESDAFAPTQAYLPAFKPDDGQGETMAYSPEERQRLLEAMMKPLDTAAPTPDRTMAYSSEDAQEIRNAYQVLKQAQLGEQPPQAAPERTDTVELAAAPQQAAAPSLAETRPPEVVVATGEIETVTEGTMALRPQSATGKRVLAAIALMILSGVVTGLILHQLGLFDLPIPIPRLLF